jgi:hypothetical protein
LHILAQQTYVARGAGFSSTGSANLQRERRGKKMLLHRALQIRARCAGANNINTLVCFQQE